jgi:hypothetical protein
MSYGLAMPQGEQPIAEPTLGHEVLRWEQPVVTVQTEFPAYCHREGVASAVDVVDAGWRR